MKAVCFQAIEDVRQLDMADPEIQTPGDVVVKVQMAGLCGSDLHPFFGRETGLDVGTVMGHELVGHVVEAGSDVRSFNIGDRVFAPFSTNCGECHFCKTGLTSRCVGGQLFGWMQDGTGLQGCQSEYVRVPMADASLMRAPESLSGEAALLLGDNFSTGYYCAEMANIRRGGIYAVIGCGTVGGLCVLSAMSMGAGKVVAIDPVAERREMAERFGAIAATPESAVSVINELTGGRGADSVMELVGLPDAQKLAYQIISPGGVMSVIGCHCTPTFAFSPVDAYDKNLTYKTGRCPARHYMGLLTERVANGEFDLDSFVTHRFSVDDCKNAYDVFSNRKNGCIKAVFDFS